jgi:hypothetical protein
MPMSTGVSLPSAEMERKRESGRGYGAAVTFCQQAIVYGALNGETNDTGILMCSHYEIVFELSLCAVKARSIPG